jgi:hypothetical protein
MSQGNLVMPTVGVVSGLTFANDINAALDALTTANSGSSAPTNGSGAAPEEGQLWLNTTTSTAPVLSQYDGTQWVTLGVIDATNHVWQPPIGGGATFTLASAATTDLGSVASAYKSITGTTTITSLGTTAKLGTIHVVTFTGALTLTYNASSLILPTAANITTTAGDVAWFVQISSGNWRCVNYTLASGQPLNNTAVDLSTVFTTGDVKWRPATGTLTGWVRINNLTIGNGVSGATEFASATASALYAYIWNNYANARCPVTGGRGASAAADFAGGKPIQLLDMRGRTPFGLDDMGNSAAGRILSSNVTSAGDTTTTMAATGGEANHVLTVGELAQHNHGVTDPQHAHQTTATSNAFSQLGGSGVNTWVSNSGTAPQAITSTNVSTGISINNTGSNTAHNTMPPFMLGTWYWKL